MVTAVRRLRSEIAPYRAPVALGGAVAASWAVWVSGPGWSTPAIVVAAVAGVALGLVDAATHRLPDAVTYPTTVAVALLLGAAALAEGSPAALGRALLGAVALGGIYLALHLLNPSGLGLGDVKLAVLLGLVSGWCGWSVFWGTVLLPFVLGGLAATALLATRRATRHSHLAFGPAMLLGTALAMSAGRLLTL